MANAQIEHTLCWDCARACSGCSWSSPEPTPVKGWIAVKTNLKTRRQVAGLNCSYLVRQCPLFVRDAFGGGMKWSDKENTVVTRRSKKGIKTE